MEKGPFSLVSVLQDSPGSTVKQTLMSAAPTPVRMGLLVLTWLLASTAHVQRVKISSCTFSVYMYGKFCVDGAVINLKWICELLGLILEGELHFHALRNKSQ